MNLIILFFAASICATVSAQLLIKKGVLGIGQISFSSTNFLSVISQIVQNIWIMLGLFFFGISFLLWIFLLSRFQLNIVYPIVVSLNFALITVGSWFLFQEHLSVIQILGIAVIVAGVLLVVPKGFL